MVVDSASVLWWLAHFAFPENVQVLVDGICEEVEGALLWAT